jgi:glc operon protein GlcG
LRGPLPPPGAMLMRMLKLTLLCLAFTVVLGAVELPSKKFLDLAAIKKLVAAAEAEAAKRNVQVTLCIMDESGNLLFLQKADGAGLNTIQFAQKKARYAALYGRPSKAAADTLASGNLQVLAFPDGFPNQGGLPIKVDGRTIGSMAASGAPSEVDEAICQAAIDALLK